MVLRIDVVILPVRHVPWAVQFYGLGLGLTLATGDHAGAASISMEGVALTVEPGASGIRLAHLAPDRAEVERILVEAIGAGATLLKPPLDRDAAGYSGWFADLDGHTWEVACGRRKVRG